MVRQDKDEKAILKSSSLSLLDTDLYVSLNIKTNASKESKLKLSSELQRIWKQFGFLP